MTTRFVFHVALDELVPVGVNLCLFDVIYKRR